jgi:hypothetical protein
LAAGQDLAAAGAFAQGDRVVVFQTGDPANYLSPCCDFKLKSRSARCALMAMRKFDIRPRTGETLSSLSPGN